MKQRKYRMQALAMLLGVIISNTCVPAVLGAEVEEEHLAVDSSKVVLAQDEHPAFCQEDLNENFEFYAAEESRVILPMMYSAEEVANVVGVVLDQETGQPVPGAIVVADKELFVTTDLDGRFQIRNMPNGVYLWSVNANGYQTSSYLNYSVDWASGTDIFTFEVSKKHTITKDRLELHGHNEESAERIVENEIQEMGTLPLSVSASPTVSKTVRVKGYSTPIPRQQYIYTVLSSELFQDSWYMNPNSNTGRTKTLTSSQVNQLYMVQALVANTYLEYALSVQGNHPGATYDVCNTTNCQVYDPTKITQRAIDCTATIFFSDTCHVLFYKNSNGSYDYALCQFFSSCYGEGTVTNPYHPEMVAKPCSDFDVGYGGHYNGMCQMGAAELARLNYGNAEIRDYYYTNCIPLYCKMV